MKPWDRLARSWQQIDTPLRPVREDLAFVQHWIDQVAASSTQPLRVLVLGTTQEYCRLQWPAGTTLLAVDHTQAMLDALWPGPPGSALCADWLSLPPTLGPFDLVLGDGVFCQLPWPVGQQRLLQQARALLRSDGLFITRLLLCDEPHESFDTALQALLAQAHASLSEVKLRLWLAQQRTPAEGCALGACWQRLVAALADTTALATLVGHPVATVEQLTTAYFNDEDRVFHFATPHGWQSLLGSTGGFMEVGRLTPAYALGRHCPSVVLRALPLRD